MKPINLVFDKDFSLNVVFPDTTNQFYAVQNSELRCTCDEFRQDNICQHVRYGQAKYDTWKRAQMRRLSRELVGDTPVDVLANSVAEKHGIDFFSDKVILMLERGDAVYVQKDTPISKRYSFGCGFGSGGRDVITIATYPATGLLTFLAQSAPEIVNRWNELDKQIVLGAHTLPVLSPRVVIPFEEHAKSAVVTNSLFAGIGKGLIDLSFDEDEEIESVICTKTHWLVRTIGLELVDEGYVGNLQYFPGMSKNDKPIGGLAIDFEEMMIKTIADSEIDRYSEEIPMVFRNSVGHVHLPWGQAHEESVFSQVIVRHPNQCNIKKDDNLQLLTTNYWAQFGSASYGRSHFESLPEEILTLAQYTAEILIRMGHRRDALLYYGECSGVLSDLAAGAYKQEAPLDLENFHAFTQLYLADEDVPDDLVAQTRDDGLGYLLPENV